MRDQQNAYDRVAPHLREAAAGLAAVVAACLACSPIAAQTAAPMTPATYECAANAHCSVSCLVDGEKIVQTGSPQTITVRPLAANNYLVEFVEQNGHIQFAYLAGARVVCTLDGLTKKAD